MIKFSSSLIKATLVRRYKRFLADVLLEDGSTVTAHCANTGAMTSCGNPGDQVLLSYNPSPKRKLPYSWELTQTDDALIVVNTSLANKVVRNGLDNKLIDELVQYEQIQSEVKTSETSRLDFYLESAHHNSKNCYLEVKSVTFRRGSELVFPDTVSSRGTKHLKELTLLAKQGYRSILLFLVNRSDGEIVRVASDIDQQYAKAMIAALESGVEVLAYRSNITREGVMIGSQIPFVFDY